MKNREEVKAFPLIHVFFLSEEIGKGGQKVQTSNYKTRICNILRGDYS